MCYGWATLLETDFSRIVTQSQGLQYDQLSFNTCGHRYYVQKSSFFKTNYLSITKKKTGKEEI